MEKVSNYRRGVWSEMLAAFYLWCKGYRLRAWRYKTAMGEIDLIATRGRSLVFIEVKYRPDHDVALSAIRFASYPRLQAAAMQYLVRNPRFRDFDQRFDLVALAPGWRIRHLDNIDLSGS